MDCKIILLVVLCIQLSESWFSSSRSSSSSSSSSSSWGRRGSSGSRSIFGRRTAPSTIRRTSGGWGTRSSSSRSTSIFGRRTPSTIRRSGLGSRISSGSRSIFGRRTGSSLGRRLGSSSIRRTGSSSVGSSLGRRLGSGIRRSGVSSRRSGWIFRSGSRSSSGSRRSSIGSGSSSSGGGTGFGGYIPGGRKTDLSSSGLRSLYNSRIVGSVRRVERPMGSLPVIGKRPYRTSHSGVVVSTADGKKWLIHKGSGYGGTGGETVITDATHMSDKWRTIGTSSGNNRRVADFVKAGGTTYSLTGDNCHHASARMCAQG